MAAEVILSAVNCGKCAQPMSVDRLPSLPCDDTFCMTCIDELSRQTHRTWSLPCLRRDCHQRFAIVQPPDPSCLPRAALQAPFTVDRYLEEVKSVAVIARRPATSRLTSQLSVISDAVNKVMGLALLGNSLFVVCARRVLLEYDVSNVTHITGPTSHVIDGLTWPRGVAASNKRQTLYIVDWQKMTGGCVWRCQMTSSASCHVTAAVSKRELSVQPFGVSVSELTSATTVLVTCAMPMIGSEQVIVFCDDGAELQQQRILSLPHSFQTPRHTLLVADGQYVSCHGWTRLRPHRVSKLVDAPNNTLVEIEAYGTTGGSGLQQLRCPLSLCLDEDGLLLVVDYYNHRIQLLTRHLQLIRHLVPRDVQLLYPRHAALDQQRGLLYVGLQSGQVHVLRVMRP